jgi:outer membrane receptor for ferrienterochelin and colicin
MTNLKKLMLLVVMFTLSFAAKAQETTSEIQGIVLEGKLAVPGATVIAIHQPTGTKYGTTTRIDGRYNLPNLKIGGPYVVTVSFVGLKTSTQDGITLLLGQTYKANFAMVEQVTSLNEVVVTSGQSKVFNSSRNGSQEIINRKLIETVPNVNRSWKDLVKLVPSQNNLSFGGVSSQLNNVTLDGANFNNSFGLGDGTLGGQTGAQPISLDAIEQIQVNVSPFDVKYGGFAGGSINTVTRSGKNQAFGSAYQFFKNKDLQGYKVGDITMPEQPFTYDLKGFTAGGAIVKNKLFFFVNGENEERMEPGTQWVAADANNTPNATNVSQARASELDALRKFLIEKYNYDPGAYQGYQYGSKSQRLTTKLDWNINDKNSFSLKYTLLRSSADIPASNSQSINASNGRRPGPTGMPFFGGGYSINNNADIIIGELNTRFSNNASNKLQIGYTSLRDFRGSLSAGNFPQVDILDGNGNPFTTFGYERFTYGNELNTDVIQLNNIFNLYKGKHEFTFGTQNSFKKYSNGFSPNYAGAFRFNSLADFYASAAGTKPAAIYDLSWSLTNDFPLVGPKNTELSLFAQDKFRVKDNLTLTYGIRADYVSFADNFLFNPVVDTLSKFYNGVRLNTGLAPAASLQISPRVGFNWDVFDNETLQIRGGSGLFQGPPPFVWISNQASNSGMALFGSITNATGYMFSPDIDKYRPTPTPGLSKAYSLNVTDPNYKFPQVWKSTLAVDKKVLGWTVTAEGTYIKNINATVFQNVALPSTGNTTLSDGRTRFVKRSVYDATGAAQTAANPNIGNAIYMTNANIGYTLFGTLQVQRQFKNLGVNASYTRQTAVDATINGSTAFTMWGARPTGTDPNNFEAGFSNNYLPHRIIASVNYGKELIKNTRTSIGLLYEASPNAPQSSLSYTYGGDINNDGFNGNDLIFVPKDASQIKLTNASAVSGVADTRTQAELWSQLDAFISNNPYLSTRRGMMSERQALLLPWVHRLDLNFTQDVYIKVKDTKHTLRFTADVYNFTNFISKELGTQQVPVTTTPLNFVKLDTDGKTPIFSFPYLDGKNKVPFTDSFRDNVGFGSRFQIQLGVRYLFN